MGAVSEIHHKRSHWPGNLHSSGSIRNPLSSTSTREFPFRTATMARHIILALLVATIFSAAIAQDEAEWIDAHNAARSVVGTPLLTWNTTLADYALAYTQTLTGSCDDWGHSGGDYGENIYWGGSTADTPTEAVQLWVSESAAYTYGPFDDSTLSCCGHYTQVVWNTTTSVGCAKVLCASYVNYPVFMICSYSPPGNYVGEYPY
ncbi:pathogenesis-related protein 1 [Physcomitrium patens]|nr:pathogenesis-related protein 1-like [Physcomitrium patens]|eukprot:XP_024401929.1 pathogenesis-related protein 1-like [Physcomitrella patens]